MNAFGQLQAFPLQLFTGGHRTILRGYLRKSLYDVSVAVRGNVTLRSVHKAASELVTAQYIQCQPNILIKQQTENCFYKY